jgi:hypothetical protein
MGFVRKVGRKLDKAIIRPVLKTVEAVVQDPKKLAMVALSVFAPGVGAAFGSALGLSGTAATIVGQAAINTALNGGNVKQAILAAAIPVVGQQLAGTISASFVSSGMDKALANTAGRVLSNAGMAAIQGKDPVTALLTGGASAGTAAITGNIPGFSDLPDFVKRTINAGIATNLSGGDGSKAAASALINSAISKASSQVAAYRKDNNADLNALAQSGLNTANPNDVLLAGNQASSNFPLNFSAAPDKTVASGTPYSSTSINDPVNMLTESNNPFTPTQVAANTVQNDGSSIQLMTDVFGKDIAAPQKIAASSFKFSAGGDIDELLRLLRS